MPILDLHCRTDLPRQRKIDVKVIAALLGVIVGLAWDVRTTQAQQGGTGSSPARSSWRQGQEVRIAAAKRWAETVAQGDKEVFAREFDAAVRLISNGSPDATPKVVISTPSSSPAVYDRNYKPSDERGTFAAGELREAEPGDDRLKLLQEELKKGAEVKVPPLHNGDLSFAAIDATKTAVAVAETPRVTVIPIGPLRSLRNDPEWISNQDFVLYGDQSDLSDDELRVLGGAEDTDEEFPSCVRIAGGRGFGSGVLIGPNVVLTAAHVISPEREAQGEAHRVILGFDGRPGHYKKLVVSKKVIRHPDYNEAKREHDIGLIILDENIQDVTPTPLSEGKDFKALKRVVVVGYGLNEFGDAGKRRKALLIVGGEPTKYGAHDYEILAMAQGVDSCKGDSGGPCLIRQDRNGKALYCVAAVVSRGIKGRAMCGEGGIQVRVDLHRPWIIKTAREFGGQLTVHSQGMETGSPENPALDLKGVQANRPEPSGLSY